MPLQGLPGGAEVWKVGNDWFAVYTIPDSDVPLMYRFERDELRTAAGATTADKTLTRAQADARGAIEFGVTSELDAQLGQHPWDSFMARVERDVDIAPWLADPEVLAHVGSAWLRGTSPNLERTQWWQSRTDQERQWLERAAANPTQARQELADTRRQVADMLRQAGVSNVNDRVAHLIADNITRGHWSPDYGQQQVRRMSDPYASGDLDPELRRAIASVGDDGDSRRIENLIGQARRALGLEAEPASDRIWADRISGGDASFGEAFGRLEERAGRSLPDLGAPLQQLVAQIRQSRGLEPDPESDLIWVDRLLQGQANLREVRERLDGRALDEGGRPGGFTATRAEEDTVRDQVSRWLGPAHGSWSEQEIRAWAGRLRNDPNAAIELEEHLRGLRMAAFPNWTNENTTYEQIASITRGMFREMWGQTPDETDSLFLKLAGMTDHDEATQILRREGWERGVTPVRAEAIRGAMQATGGQIQRAV